MTFEAATSEFTVVIHTDAAAQDVFPLLCPVREDDWLHGWAEATTMIHSESGVAELGAVFQTRHGETPVQTWVITRYEPDVRIAFARFGGDVVTRLEIELQEVHGTTHSEWTTSQVGVSEAGNAAVRSETRESHDASRAGLALALQQYLRTGQTIDEDALHRHAAAG